MEGTSSARPAPTPTLGSRAGSQGRDAPCALPPLLPGLSFPICSQVLAGSWPVCGLGAAWTWGTPRGASLWREGRVAGAQEKGFPPLPPRDMLPSLSPSLSLTIGGQAQPQAAQGVDSSWGPSAFPSGENCWGGWDQDPGLGGWPGRDLMRVGEQPWQAALLATRLDGGPFRGRDGKLTYNICFSPTFASWLVQHPLPSRALHLGPG